MSIEPEETIRALRLIEDLIRTAELSLNQAKLDTSELRRAFMRDRHEEAAPPTEPDLDQAKPKRAGSRSN